MTDPKAMQVTERVTMRGGPGRGGPFGGGIVGQKAIRFGPSVRRLLRRLAPHRARVLVMFIAGVVSVALSTLGPKVLGRATDLIFAGVMGKRFPAGITKEQAIEAVRAQGQERVAEMMAGIDLVPGRGVDVDALQAVLLLALGLYVASALLSFLQGYLLNDIVQLTVKGMRADVEEKIHRIPLPTFDRQPRGELLSRVTNDIDNVAQSLQQTMSQIVTSVLGVLFVTGMMVYISPTLALIALLTIPVTMLGAGVVMRRSQRHFVTQWRSTGRLNSIVEEAYTGHVLVQVYGRRPAVEAQLQQENEALYQASFRAQFLSGLIMPVAMFIGNLTYVALAVVGGLRVASGAMSLGDVQAFIQYSRNFTRPITQIASMINMLQSGVASAERVFELLDVAVEPATVDPTEPAARPQGRVAFEGVSFRYEPDKPLLEGVSFRIDPGQTVAIVGPTGAGKTTLINLLMRFYEPDGGRITLDGVDISTMERQALRSKIGIVLQDTWLFRGTIRENIAYGRPDADEQELLAAAKAAFVDRFVQSLPDGYDTVVDDEGGAVSAGEKQLITIARAYLSRPALLILDEATSSVDTRTELLVQQAMAALRESRTSFIIAHRLSTIRSADVILVMEEGRIVEQGTHRALLDQGGAYAALYLAQLKGTDGSVEAAPSHT
ncbi:MAG: ABC transporter ATP-binding protein [Alphaproteobacteria bacterium]|nr:ABC transporter ATP-binding protein [Alphaproteobacteria bacterium]